MLRVLYDILIASEPLTLDVLELCGGTGLAGKAFSDLARRLDGLYL